MKQSSTLVILLILACSFVACYSSGDSLESSKLDTVVEGKNGGNGDYQAVTEVGRVYQSLLELDIKAQEAVFEKMLEYLPFLQAKMEPCFIFYDRWPFSDGGFGDLLDPQKRSDWYEDLSKIWDDRDQAAGTYIMEDTSFLDKLPTFKLYGIDERPSDIRPLLLHSGDILLSSGVFKTTMQLYLLRSELEGKDMAAIRDDMDKVSLKYDNIIEERQTDQGKFEIVTSRTGDGKSLYGVDAHDDFRDINRKYECRRVYAAILPRPNEAAQR